MTISSSRPVRIAHRARRIWTELDYAQRRLFEIRTGVSDARSPRSSHPNVAELERVYRHDAS